MKVKENNSMSRELKEIRTNINEELVMSINEAVDYCNKYYSCLYFDDDAEDVAEDDDRYTVDEHCEEAEIEDAKILLALQDRAINLMKRATYKELELAFPLNTDAFDSWDYGIAYKGDFICGCCGGVFKLEVLAEDGLEIVELPWVSLRDEIRGE